jgi:tRNA (cmo5U34)-methyltransferase
MNMTTSHIPSDLETRGRFVPGYAVMLQMAAQLTEERIGLQGTVLILGAGGGLEIEAFSARAPAWTFLAVDPDRTMLEAARERARICGTAERVTWIDGYIFDAPATLCDAAVCLLTLHFVPGEEAKLDTLKALRARLKPDAPLVLVDLCMDKRARDYDLRLSRYERFAIDSGAEPNQAASTRERVRNVIDTLSPSVEENLVRKAGFEAVDLFYAGLSWRGWLAYA